MGRVAHIEPRCPELGVGISRRMDVGVALRLLALSSMHASPPMSTQTSVILLVEDDPSLQDSLKTFLEESGFETHTAGSRSQGQAMLRSLRPAVCLLDLNLPDGSGLDLLKLILREGLPVRVIVMSAMPLQRLHEQFPSSILATTMTKPVSPQHLLEWVDRITRS